MTLVLVNYLQNSLRDKTTQWIDFDHGNWLDICLTVDMGLVGFDYLKNLYKVVPPLFVACAISGEA